MSRPRKNSVQIVVEVDGVEITANLRRQRGKTGNWEVRWRLNGVRGERSTETQVFQDAVRKARRIIRGEEEPDHRRRQGMTVAEFEAIQDKHFRLASSPAAGEKSRASFYGIWRSFQKACSIKVIQEVDEAMALGYLSTLLRSDRNRNHNYKKWRKAKPMSLLTVHKHIRTLSSAWNLVRRDHPERMAGIAEAKKVAVNPWESVRNDLPKVGRKKEPVQFKPDNDELLRFLEFFHERPIAELFIIVSLWCAGRIQEMTSMEWTWIHGNYIVVPPEIAKGGRGKVVRIPATIRSRMEACRVAGSRYVFAGFAAEVERALKSCHAVQDFSPQRMQWRMQKLIKQGAEAIGRPEITHHALRRTGMELSNEGELRDKKKASAAKLQTTVGNMERNYLARVGKKERILADGLYENLTVALQDYPALALRLGCDAAENAVEQEMEELMKRLNPIQRRRLQKRLVEDSGDVEEQGVA